MIRFWFFLLLIVTSLSFGCSLNSPSDNSVDFPNPSAPSNVEPLLVVRLLNVGQGDAILINTPTQVVLFDTSDTDERNLLRDELSKAGVTKIDKLILSHPHADHIGGAKLVIEQFNVNSVFDNGLQRPSFNVYKGYVNAASARNIPLNSLRAGDSLDLGGGVKLDFLYPSEDLLTHFAQEGDYNNTSLVARLSFHDFSLLLTGDAEKPVENELLNSSPETLPSTVLKAGHHASKSSNGLDFIRAVNPKIVLISAGQPGKSGGNTYGHPHKQALQNFLKAGVDKMNIFWTFMNGTVTISSDGHNFTVHSEKGGDWLDEYLR